MGGAVEDGSGTGGCEGQWEMGGAVGDGRTNRIDNEHEISISCLYHYNSREVSQYSHRGGILRVFSEVKLHVSWMSS